jgi:hypothetical protein
LFVLGVVKWLVIVLSILDGAIDVDDVMFVSDDGQVDEARSEEGNETP